MNGAKDVSKLGVECWIVRHGSSVINKWARGLVSRSGGWLLNGGFEAFNCPVLIAHS